MNTLRLTTNKKDLETAKTLLKKGEIIATPTDTVYGLIALASNKEACKKIYELKNRPKEKKLILFCNDIEMVKKYVTEFSEITKKLSDKFWPGPLTLILKVNHETIGFRIPKHNALLNLIKSLGEPLASTSANLANQPNATSGKEVLEIFNSKISAIIEDENVKPGRASTILDCTGTAPTLLRQGALTPEQLFPSVSDE